MKKKYISFALLFVCAISAVLLLSSGISKESRYDGGGRNLVEELYEQAVKQNDNLESIEDDIEKFRKKKYEAVEKYNGFTSYNNRYYTDARETAA
jgi:hypothetical protein